MPEKEILPQLFGKYSEQILSAIIAGGGSMLTIISWLFKRAFNKLEKNVDDLIDLTNDLELRTVKIEAADTPLMWVTIRSNEKTLTELHKEHDTLKEVGGCYLSHGNKVKREHGL